MPKYKSEDDPATDESNPLEDEASDEDLLEEMSLEGFMNFGSDRAGFGSSFLKKWKEDGSILVAHHKSFMLTPVLAHGWPKLVELRGDDDSDGEPEKDWRMRRWICHEGSDLFKRRYHRQKKTKERLFPPCSCAKCILDEWMWQAIEVKQTIDPFDVAFEFADPEAQANFVLPAGPMIGIKFGKHRPLTNDQKKVARHLHIDIKKLFMFDTQVKLQWLVEVVPVNDPSNGLQLAFVPPQLGQAIADAVKKERRRAFLGPEKNEDAGDPRHNPYPFEWTYAEDGDIKDRYKCTAMRGTEMSQEVLDILEGDDRPDSKQLRTRGDMEKLRADMESFCVLGDKAPDWDVIFDVKKTKVQVPASKPSDKAAPKAEVKKQEPKANGKAKKEPEPEPEEDVEMVKCSVCDKAMSLEDVECPNCGATYDEHGEVDAVKCVDCGTMVDVTEPDPKTGRVICGKCALVYQVEKTHDDEGSLFKATPVRPPPKKVAEKAPTKPPAKAAQTPTKRRGA